MHAVRDRRPPPRFDLSLDKPNADKRFAWCGAWINIVIPEFFDTADRQACPACVKVVSAVPPA